MLRHLVHLSNVLMVGIPSNALTVTIVTSLLRQLGGYSNSKQEFGFGSVDYSLPYDKIGQILDDDYPTILDDSVSLEWIASAFIAIGTELVLQYAKDSRHSFNVSAFLNIMERLQIILFLLCIAHDSY